MREQHFPLSKVADKNKDVMIKVRSSSMKHMQENLC